MGLNDAAIVLDPGGVISWLAVGLIAGWLAGLVMKGGGFGVLGSVALCDQFAEARPGQEVPSYEWEIDCGRATARRIPAL